MNGWVDDSDLPNLQTSQLDYFALQGDDSGDQETISEEPYNYTNTLTMKSESAFING